MKSARVCSFIMGLLCLSARAEPRLLNAVLVRVNDAIITRKDLENRIVPDLDLLQRQYGAQPEMFNRRLRELEQQHLDLLVEEQLILHEFKTAGYVLPESFLESEVEKDIKKFGDRVTLTKTLQAQGLTYENYRARVKEGLIVRLMRQQNVPQDPVVSPHKIEVYYVQNRDKFKVEDQIKLRMIMLTNRPNERLFSPGKLAREILTKMEQGASFDEMARIYSDGSQSIEGGDYGWKERSFFRADLAEKAFALKPGQRSGVIEAPDGCYLMLVEGVQPAHIKSLSEVRDDIETTLKDEELRRLRRKWIDRLKSKSFLRYF